MQVPLTRLLTTLNARLSRTFAPCQKQVNCEIAYFLLPLMLYKMHIYSLPMTEKSLNIIGETKSFDNLLGNDYGHLCESLAIRTKHHRDWSNFRSARGTAGHDFWLFFLRLLAQLAILALIFQKSYPCILIASLIHPSACIYKRINTYTAHLTASFTFSLIHKLVYWLMPSCDVMPDFLIFWFVLPGSWVSRSKIYNTKFRNSDPIDTTVH